MKKKIKKQSEQIKFALTGTQVYGPVTASSDVDIVMLFTDAKTISDILESHDIPIYQNEKMREGNYTGFYFDIGVVTINIICVDDERGLRQWKDATDEMLTHPVIEDKEKRKKTFQEIFKSLA